MKGEGWGLAKILYTEWILLIHDYFLTLYFNIVLYEIIVPILAAAGCSLLYTLNGLSYKALNSLGSILPTSVSILIGFSVMFITILITRQNENIETLKTSFGQKTIKNGREVDKPRDGFNLYQKLLSQFAYSLTVEIFLMILVLAYLFVSPFIKTNAILLGVFLFVQVFFILHALLIILREMANVYFVFFKSNKDTNQIKK